SAPTAQTVLIVTATPASISATSTGQTPTELLTTVVPTPGGELTPTEFAPTPTDANANPVSPAAASPAIQVSSPTPVGTNIPIPPTPTIAPISGGSAPGASSDNPATLPPVSASSNANGLPPKITVTELVAVPGGIFQMGTTLKEIQQAVDDCVTRDK